MFMMALHLSWGLNTRPARRTKDIVTAFRKRCHFSCCSFFLTSNIRHEKTIRHQKSLQIISTFKAWDWQTTIYWFQKQLVPTSKKRQKSKNVVSFKMRELTVQVLLSTLLHPDKKDCQHLPVTNILAIRQRVTDWGPMSMLKPFLTVYNYKS